MVRSSYQKGSIRRRKRKHGIVYELRYRIKNGTNMDGSTSWLEKTEELRNDKGQLCKTDSEAERARDERMREINLLNTTSRSITVAEFISTRWQQCWHIFRHSAATIIDSETKNRRLAQELLRHTNIVTTSRYTHNEGTAAEATELLARRIGAGCGQSVVETATTVH